MFTNASAAISIPLGEFSLKSARAYTGSKVRILLSLMFCAMTAIPSLGQTFKTLVTFSGNDNYNSPLIQGTDGHFYGTSSNTIFKITPGGTPTTLYTFCSQPKCTDGEDPSGALIQGTDGNFYGTTVGGGTATGNQFAQGTVYKLTPQGTFTSLHTFIGADGAKPTGGLVQGADGSFYGTTATEGGPGYQGTIFKISSTGDLTTLYSFPVGFAPISPLVQGSNGNFYGDTQRGGGTGCQNNEGCGIIFEITPSGIFTSVASLEEPDGDPQSALTLGADGNLYGTATAPQVGAVFALTSEGALNTLYTFTGGAGGQNPEGGVVQGTDGNFYGTTMAGGSRCGNLPNESCGTVFELTPSGTLTTLHAFSGAADGSSPITTLMQSTNGTFYGRTATTIFSVSTSLGPFVIPQPASGAIGKKITILGTNLTGTSAVSFNGTSATFTATGSAINTTVPAGATSGTITVTTPGGTLSSNISFTVVP